MKRLRYLFPAPTLENVRHIARRWLIIGSLSVVFSVGLLLAHFGWGVPVENDDTGRAMTSSEITVFLGVFTLAGAGFATAGLLGLRWVKMKRSERKAARQSDRLFEP